jgi:hypothetical protein
MAFKSVLVEVSDEAVVVSAAIRDRNGKTTCFQNLTRVDVWLGGSDVAVDGPGYKLANGAVFTVALELGDQVYAVIATGTQDLNVTEVGALP